MNELPTPTLPLSTISLPRGSLHRPGPEAAAPAGALEVRWARHQDEVRQAQRLRYRVFAEEMGARLDSGVPGHDLPLDDPDWVVDEIVRWSARLQRVSPPGPAAPACA